MSGLGTSCMLLLANICLHHVSALEIHDSGLSASATVHGKGFTAEVTYLSDSFGTPNWAEMNAACWQGECVAYHKWCAEKDGKKYCRYDFSQPGDLQNSTIEIFADDQETLLTTTEDFGVLVNYSLTTVEVSLKQFEINSPSELPPNCPGRKAQTACWPKPRK